MTERLGDRLREARERKRMTQQEVAKALGVSRESVGNWESGVSTPRNRMAALEELLDIGRTVSPTGEGGLMLLLPEDALIGLTPIEVEEVLSVARTAAMERARQIRYDREQATTGRGRR